MKSYLDSTVFVVGAAGIVIVLIILGLYEANKNRTNCERQGGVYFLQSGICMKGEKIPL